MSPRKKIANTMEIMLLGLLDGEPMHGYDLFKYLSRPDGLSRVWHINQSNLYAMLDSLEQDGSLESQLIQVGNSPMRKEYHLTAEGTQRYKQWIREPVLHGRDMRQVFLAKLYFALKESSETAFELVQKQKAVTETWKREVEASMQNLNADNEFDRLVFCSRLKQISGWQEWLDDCAGSLLLNRTK
ncbi:hypothetical protein ADM99_00490 [Leptolinea tardivitalis]|uniref:Transcription regulator PadR N-terminal domain-containing protein n=2 Tax=Leptolinea tardivitalis TaxID=229920 RepID=A0A0P6X570_9CHLR|nr:hypothetical protein ADM99_00490 [Leptolinea tardivitalis]GAP20388.1 transcriptional regulator, PadR family [Leptolinea tardivitalis]